KAVAAAQNLQRADPNDRDGDGISGVPNVVFNPETGQNQLGRFGWKAQVPTLHLFSGDAYLNEMGITTPTFPNENLPQGQPIPPGTDAIPGLEDDGTDVNKFANLMKFLGAPPRQNDTAAATSGERILAHRHCPR